MAAVDKDCTSLKYASEDLKNDRDVFMAAVKTNGTARALEHASEELKDDRGIVMADMRKSGHVFVKKYGYAL